MDVAPPRHDEAALADVVLELIASSIEGHDCVGDLDAGLRTGRGVSEAERLEGRTADRLPELPLAFIFSQGWRERAFAAFVILTTRLFSVVSGDCDSRRDAVPRHARAEVKADAC